MQEHPNFVKKKITDERDGTSLECEISEPDENTCTYAQIHNRLVWFLTLQSKFHLDFLNQNKRSTGINSHLSISDFTLTFSGGLIFIYQQPNHKINENQRWYRKAA